jgi:cytochrome c
MKSIIYLLLIPLVIIACQEKTDNSFQKKTKTESPASISGKDLFNGKGTCGACHLADKKVIGPSIQEISKIYKEKGASIADFLKGKSEPIVDPSQYVVMKENLKLLQTFSDEEIKALADYMLEF